MVASVEDWWGSRGDRGVAYGIADKRFSSDGTSGRGRTARYKAGPISFKASVD